MVHIAIAIRSRFAPNEDGATAIEYALLAALIALAIITAVFALGGSLADLYDTIGGEVGDAAP